MSLKLNTFQLKIIASVLMVIDHFAYFFMDHAAPLYVICRIIGRVSAPIFWFCFVEGFKHSKDRLERIKTLLIASCLMGAGNFAVSALGVETIPQPFVVPNAFLTFVGGAFMIYMYDEAMKKLYEENDRFGGLVVIITMFVLNTLLMSMEIEYGSFAIFSMLIFHMFREKKVLRTIIFVIVSIGLCFIEKNWIQVFMILALLPISCYTDEKPKKAFKKFFYIFYPAHIWMFSLLSKFFHF